MSYSLIDPFFENFFNHRQERNSYFNEVMKTDIKDEGDHYQLAIDLPSIKKEDIKLALDDGHRERHYGNYSRSFYVGDQVKEEDIKAKLDEGVLHLSIRKAEEKEADSKKFISIE